MALADIPIDQRHNRTIQAWLLALLRYAITLDREDRLVVLAAASQIDKGQRQSSDFCFFHRTSAALCEAMALPRPDNRHILLRHVGRIISDPRMKRAFAAVFDLDQPIASNAAADPHRPRRRDLWTGLDLKTGSLDF